jgi:hypothetical protein
MAAYSRSLGAHRLLAALLLLGLAVLIVTHVMQGDDDDDAPNWPGVVRSESSAGSSIQLSTCIDIFPENIESLMWESDFIYGDLFGAVRDRVVRTMWNHKKIQPGDIRAINDSRKRCGKVVFILHARRNEFCPSVLELWRAVRPDVVFLLSDEHGNHRCYDDVAAESARVVLRQYSVRKYGWTEYKNVFTIMLGTQGFTQELMSLPMKSPHERPYIWSFSGNKKSDRVYMTKVLSQHLSPHRFVWHGMKPVEMVRDLYMESIFVPVGRGGASLDCFRMYEACRAGAIPIVVGPRDEIVKTFSTYLGYEEQLPPFVSAHSWAGAVREVKLLMRNATALLERQKGCREFWERSLEATRKLLWRTLEL